MFKEKNFQFEAMAIKNVFSKSVVVLLFFFLVVFSEVS